MVSSASSLNKVVHMRLSGIILSAVFMMSHANPAFAIPSFAAQTGQPCSACHVGAFGPQLKPYGRDFKLYGYVTSDRPKDNLADNWYERFTMMAKGGFTHTNSGQSPAPAEGTGPNDNFTFDQLAGYYGGRITPEIGGIQEFSYDGINHKLFWDAMDVRHAWEGTVLGTDYVGGILASNQLGNTSFWNSTPPNSFPYNSSGVAPSPQAGNLFDDTLNGQVFGPGAYISWNSWLYAETTLYFPLNRRVDQTLGNPSPAKYDGVIPFWHAAIEHDFFNHEHYFQVGTFGATADRYPGGISVNGPATVVGPKDHITDIALEANYQWLADLHNMISAHATYTHEKEDLNATFSQGASDNASNHLNTFKADVTYSIDDTYVPSLQYFKTSGSRDATLYSSSLNGSPNSEGYTIDLAYVPFGKPDSPGYNWGNMRAALEYTGYTMFNGTSKHATDNNTIFLNLWFTLAPLVPAFSHDKAAASDNVTH